MLDGELVADELPETDGGLLYRFLAFDLLAYDGRIMIQRDFMSRLGYLKERVVDVYNDYLRAKVGRERSATTAGGGGGGSALLHSSGAGVVISREQPFTIELKKLERAYAVDRVVESIKHLRHGNDGLIFTAARTPYELGTCASMLKWKPPELNSVDFQVGRECVVI